MEEYEKIIGKVNEEPTSIFEWKPFAKAFMESTVAWIKEVKNNIKTEKEEKENEKKPEKEKAPKVEKPSGPTEVETRFFENLRRLINNVKKEQKKFT